MTTTLYLDLFSGISGDMFLGAMIDLGVELSALEQELSRLGLQDYHLHADRQTKASIAGVRFEVHAAAEHSPPPPRPAPAPDPHAAAHGHPPDPDRGAAAASPHAHPHPPGHHHAPARTFADIRSLIERSALSDWVRSRAVAVFHRIAEAEGRIHGVSAEAVHFHEVGAVDSIVDIVGACIALERLGRPRVLASPVIDGTGWIRCAHGRLPLPAPATLAILGARGVALTQCEEPHELVTPTGAALLAEFAESFGPMQGLVAAKIGFGLGARDLASRPNALRAVLGRTASETGASPHDWETDVVGVLETNLDDVAPEILGHFAGLARAEGALEVFHTPVQMKKDRPGVLLTLLCGAGDIDRFAALILRETSAFGVRFRRAERRKLRREVVPVETAFGEVLVKLGRLDGQVIQAAPEFESCRQVAARAGVPLRLVYEAVGRVPRPTGERPAAAEGPAHD